MDVFDLFAKISVDTKEYDTGLERASGKTATFADKLKSGLSTAAKVGAAAVTAVAAATTAMAGAVVKGTSEVAAYGDNIDKMSQKMGMSAVAYQEWDAVMQHSGTSIESMKAGMKTLATAAETGNKAFAQLGITQTELASMSQEELFGATIAALQNVESETERTYLAGQLLGRGATELGALLNTSAEDTQAMKDRVHELGGVMSNEAVKAAAAYQDSLQDMQTAFQGISRGMISEFLPSITTVMDGLTEIFSGNGETGLALVSQGLSDFVGTLGEIIPKVMEVGGKILEGLASAIMENLPGMTKAATEIIATLVGGIGNALPAIVDSAIQILQILATAIIENLPALGDAALEIIFSIVDILIENLPQIVVVGLQIVAGLALGLLQAIPKLIMAIPKLVKALIDGFCELLGIHSPSTVFAEMGGNVVAGLLEGISNAWNSILEFFGDAVAALLEFLSNAWDGISETAATAWEAITGVFSAAWKAIQGVFAGAVTFFAEIWQGIQTVFSVVTEVLGGFFAAAWQGIQSAWDGTVTFFSGVWDGVKEVFSVVAEVLGGFFSAAWEAILAVWGSTLEFFKKVGEGIQNVFGTVTDSIFGFFEKAWEKVETIWSAGVDFFAAVIDGIIAAFEGVAAFIGGAFSAAWEAVTAAWGNVTGFFQGIWTSILGVFSNVGSAFMEIGSNIVNGIKSGIEGGWRTLTNWVSEKVGGIVNAVEHLLGINSPSKVFAGIGENMALGLGEGWKDEYDHIKGQIEDGMNFEAGVISVAASGLGKASVDGIGGTRRGGSIGDTYNFYSPKALDAVSAAREMKKAKQQLAMGFI